MCEVLGMKSDFQWPLIVGIYLFLSFFPPSWNPKSCTKNQQGNLKILKKQSLIVSVIPSQELASKLFHLVIQKLDINITAI